MEDIDISYQQTIDYLLAQLPMFSRVGAVAYKKNLDNIIALCKALDNPQEKFKSVHIAGTNGKGSVSHMLAAIFQSAGYKTGLYTSPHLKDFRERIRVNGEMISKRFVVNFVQNLQPLIQSIQPSFFEITVAMAFAYFAAEKTDIAIVETGLGGRLDSTNIIIPELSIITNISYDHQNLLGNTLPEIAGEKAGIIKQNVPVIIGESQVETDPVFIHKAKEMQSPAYFADQEWTVVNQDDEKIVIKENSSEKIFTYYPDLPGIYQQKNICTVLCSIKILQSNWNITEQNIETGLSHVKNLTGLRGRWDIIGTHPLIVLDVAHNEAGIKTVIQQVSQQPYQKLHIVTGFVKDKNVAAVLQLFPADALYYFCNADIPRALPANELQAMAEKNNLPGNAYPTVKEAFNAAKENAGVNDMILVCGSFFIVSEVI